MPKQYNRKQMGGVDPQCFEISTDGDTTTVKRAAPANTEEANSAEGNAGTGNAGTGNAGTGNAGTGNEASAQENAAAPANAKNENQGGGRRKPKAKAAKKGGNTIVPSKLASTGGNSQKIRGVTAGGECKVPSSIAGGYSRKVISVPGVTPTGGSPKKTSPKHKYNGREYTVRTGTKGGKYILVKGEKKYIH